MDGLSDMAVKDVNIGTPIPDREKVKDVTDTVMRINQQRAVYQRQWLINIAMLYGKHYFAIDKKPTGSLDERVMWELKNMERQSKTRRQSNYILPLFKSQLAKMILTKSNVNVEPTTNSEQDKSAARVSKEVAEDFWQNVNRNNPHLCDEYGGMLKILLRLCIYMMCCGEGYLLPYFNPRTQSKFFLNEQIGTADIGEVETEVLHVFETFRDPLKRFFIRTKTMAVEHIYERWGKEVKDEQIGYPDYQKRMIAMLEQGQEISFKDAAEIFEKYELPSKKYPAGRHLVCTKEELVLEEDLPPHYKGRLPLFSFQFMDFMLAPFAQSFIEQLVPLQEEYNYTLTRLYGYKKWFAGKVLIPRNSKMSTKWDDEMGQVIFYNSGHGVPGYLPGANAPAFLIQDLDRIRRDMEDVGSSHDTSLGRTPAGVKSGVGIQNLTDLDNAQSSPMQMDMESKLGQYVETVLDIMEANYNEPRFLAMTGDTLAADVRSFVGSDLMGNRKIKVVLGSSLPYTKEARQNKIMEYLGAGLISGEKARELLEMGDIDGVFSSIDETAEKSEVLQMMKDNVVVVAEPWEEHNIRAHVLTQFMKSQEYMKLPDEIRQRFITHLGEHQEYIRQEAQAAARVGAPTGSAIPPKPTNP